MCFGVWGIFLLSMFWSYWQSLVIGMGLLGLTVLLVYLHIRWSSKPEPTQVSTYDAVQRALLEGASKDASNAEVKKEEPGKTGENGDKNLSKCPACGGKVEMGICFDCGARICPSCGAPNSGDEYDCIKCGSEL